MRLRGRTKPEFCGTFPRHGDMKSAAQTLAQELASTPPAVITPDPKLVDEVSRILAGQTPSPALWFTYDTALQQSGAVASRPIFLDLRDGVTAESPLRLLTALARRNGNRTPVVAIGGRTFERLWANEADLAVHGYLGYPLQLHELEELLQSDRLVRRVRETPQLTDPRVIEVGAFHYLTYTPSMYEMLDQLERVAAHDVTLLLIGETGTGKTTIARLVHELSPRRGDAFLTVACGSLPPELIESELFGHVRGAFTSADRSKVGKFEAAGRGSLLLDEIDVLGAVQQTKLLRVIETGEFEMVGSNETHMSQARLIVASNVDLKELMQRNEFRADLYYRLNVLEFHIPPLRERPRDIVPLTLGFIDEFATTHGIRIERIHPEFLAALKNYDWPGNIRELKNHIRRAVLFSRGGQLTVQDLALGLLQPRAGASTPAGLTLRESTSLSARVAVTEQEILEAALRANGYRRTATAQALGISRVGLYKKMRKYGLLNGTRRRSTAASVASGAGDSADSQD